MAATERTPLLQPESESELNFTGKDASGTTISKWRRVLGITLALTGVFVAGADQSFVMVTYEVIASHFGDVSDSAWVLTGYNLGFCIALPVYGKMSDSYGRKIPLVTSYCLFSIGCIFSGTGVFLWQVIAGRVITGLGGAGMLALVSVIITDNVLPNKVAIMRSYANVFSVAGRSFGGPIGALITDALGWRWSFIFQAPVALLCCIFCVLLLSSGKQVDNDSKQLQKPREPQKIDYLGIGSFTISITSLLGVIELCEKGRPEITRLLILTGIAFSSGLFFLLIEIYHAEEPLISPSLLKTISGICFPVQMLLLLGRQSHASSLAPYFLRTEELDINTAALKIIPSPIGFTVGSIFAGYIIQRTNKYKILCIVSLVFGVLSYLAIAIRWGDQPNTWEFLYIFPAGLSLGVVLACTFTGLTISTPKPLQATAISMYYLCQQVGGMIGTAVSSVVLHALFQKTLEDRFGGIANKEEIIQGILNDPTSLSVPEKLRNIVQLSYRHSFQYIALLPCLATALALPLILLAPEVDIA